MVETNTNKCQLDIDDFSFPFCSRNGHKKCSADMVCVESTCLSSEGVDISFCRKCEDEGLHKDHSVMLADKIIKNIYDKVNKFAKDCADQKEQNSGQPLSSVDEIINKWYAEAKLLRDLSASLVGAIESLQKRIQMTKDSSIIKESILKCFFDGFPPQTEFNARMKELLKMTKWEQKTVELNLCIELKTYESSIRGYSDVLVGCLGQLNGTIQHINDYIADLPKQNEKLQEERDLGLIQQNNPKQSNRKPQKDNIVHPNNSPTKNSQSNSLEKQNQDLKQALSQWDDDFFNQDEIKLSQKNKSVAQKPPSKDQKISMHDQFTKECVYKMIQYFEYNTNRFHYLLLDEFKKDNHNINTFQLQEEFITPDMYRSVITRDGVIFMVGGKQVGENEKDVEVLNECWELDFSKKEMISAKNMQCCRADQGIVCIGQKIYVIGGYAGGGDNCINSCEEYDIDADEWIDIADYPLKARAIGCCSFNDEYIQAFGGSPQNGTFFRYKINDNRWNKVEVSIVNAKEANKEYNPCCVQINSQQILVFGYDNQNHKNSKGFLVQVDDGNKDKVVLKQHDELQIPVIQGQNDWNGAYIQNNSLYVVTNENEFQHFNSTTIKWTKIQAPVSDIDDDQ